MKCVACKTCTPDAKVVGRCPYGGPFVGYTDAEGRPITLKEPDDGPSPAPSTAASTGDDGGT